MEGCGNEKEGGLNKEFIADIEKIVCSNYKERQDKFWIDQLKVIEHYDTDVF